MPCYFVSNEIEIPMTNETFDFIWNGFGNKELTDSETSSSYEEGAIKQVHLMKKLDSTWVEKAGRRILQEKIERRNVNFQRCCQEKTKQSCVCDVCGSDLNCKSNLVKHKKTKKYQRFLVWVHYDFMIQENIMKL